MSQQSFSATLQTDDKGRVFVAVPFNPAEAWGEKPRHHVRGTVNDMPYRGPLDTVGGPYFMVLGAAWRRDCGIDVGDEVTVVLEAEGPQQDTLAKDIAEALATEPKAKAFFDGLATFYRKNYIRWIEGAKRPETRAARIREMVALLKNGKKQK
ncbi:MAG: DUF1905 domain-containing protein [Anaerolineae bacterium]|nr:DUF1905 domain-containing protein [Anaerolineae bacterium]